MNTQEPKEIHGGLRHDASDDTPQALEAANHNYLLISRDRNWCFCQPEGEQVYYRSARTGSHGWMCCNCRGITQTG